MSYLGIGVSPTEPSLGYMLKDAQGSLFTLPWCTAFPAAVVILLILGVSLVGEGVRERMGVASGCWIFGSCRWYSPAGAPPLPPWTGSPGKWSAGKSWALWGNPARASP